jgi:hypothetical protein
LAAAAHKPIKMQNITVKNTNNVIFGKIFDVKIKCEKIILG